MKWVGVSNGTTMAGVTIGVGNYVGKAEIAARQFAWATGLPAAIIEDTEVPSVAKLIAKHCPPTFPWQEIAFAVKVFLFDLLPHDRVVYFDADLLAMNRWDPAQLAPKGLHVVRDLFFAPWIENEARVWELCPGEYFNSGLLVLSLAAHLPVLREAARWWCWRETGLHDQTPLNFAARQTGVEIRWLHRDFNLINGERSCEAGRFAVKGLHVGGGWPESAYGEVLARGQGCGLACLSLADAGLGGIWRYGRGGESRPVTFQEDGAIGLGSMNCERFWRVWSENGQPMLGVFGYCGPGGVSETFHASRDGAVWRGRWNRFEQDEVTLTPCDCNFSQWPENQSGRGSQAR